MLRVSNAEGVETTHEIHVIEPWAVHSIVIQLSPTVSHPLEFNESSTIDGSYRYVHVDARTEDQTPILLPKEAVSIIGQDDALETGTTGFWISKPDAETIQVQIRLGDTVAFAYID